MILVIVFYTSNFFYFFNSKKYREIVFASIKPLLAFTLLMKFFKIKISLTKILKLSFKYKNLSSLIPFLFNLLSFNFFIILTKFSKELCF